MAYREKVIDEQLQVSLEGANFFYNISASVGWGCPNRQTDVMLVQYLLRKAGDSPHGQRPYKKQIGLDGIFGPQTHKWITWFQREETGYWTGVDGRVDTTDGAKTRSTKTKKDYTIHWLNNFFKMSFPLLYSDVTIDQELPSILCDELSTVVIDGEGEVNLG